MNSQKEEVSTGLDHASRWHVRVFQGEEGGCTFHPDHTTRERDFDASRNQALGGLQDGYPQHLCHARKVLENSDKPFDSIKYLVTSPH